MEKLAENILSWCKNIEDGAVKQAMNIAKLPYLAGNVCLMPDAHEGFGMPIGGVAALSGAISPNMVGVDIGCGMLAVKTSLNAVDIEDLKKILGGIRKVIPVGFDHQTEAQKSPLFDDPRWPKLKICYQQMKSAAKQLGTLGGGNHFIEIQKGDDGHIWFMIHSGSRNLGHKVATHYNDIAKKLCETWKHSEIVKNDLAFLPEHTEEFYYYKNEMEMCLDFAYENRKHMANAIKLEFLKVIEDVQFVDEINIHHNYAALEHHYGRNVWVHRKGATLAREGITGIIPGSQGTASYIVQGLGNEASMCSCSHGAGRKMSRKKAVEQLDLAEEQRILDEKGVLHALYHKSGLDEAPSAYKDIDEVMEQQKDLVKILVKLEPLAVVKG